MSVRRRITIYAMLPSHCNPWNKNEPIKSLQRDGRLKIKIFTNAPSQRLNAGNKNNMFSDISLINYIKLYLAFIVLKNVYML